ncbi:carbohydrate ABC transporter permease [Bacillota bacterium Meth-B3]|nr:carbohydrate ABC transporter permease [Christensenellaceae bacterium]MEA5067257.1 carbohydrate ABC transporter permease [Eubacteriales bacterium]
MSGGWRGLRAQAGASEGAGWRALPRPDRGDWRKLPHGDDARLGWRSQIAPKRAPRARKGYGGKILLSVLAAILLLPIALTFFYSFFPTSEIRAYLGMRGNYDATAWMPIKLSPQVASLRQYYRILIEDTTVLKLYVNSAVYAGAILLGQALVIPMLAYALSRFRFPGRDALFFVVLMLMLMPFQVTMVPNVITLRQLGIMNTVWAVILPMCFAPFIVFLLRQYMVSLPDELVEAGEIDGAGTWRTFIHVVLPVSRPILGAAAALSFADCWNLVEQPLVYLGERYDLQPLSVMFGQIGTDAKEIAFAGAAVYILPALFVYLFFQEDIQMGIQLSELK